MDRITKFKERFNEVLKFAYVRQIDLASAANVSRQCISDYKSGRSVPSIDTLYLMCKYLDVSADYVLGLER